MFKSIDRWGIPYLRQCLNRKTQRKPEETHIMFTVCDHFEPLSPHAAKSIQQGEARVKRWLDEWPGIAKNYRDNDGYTPKHSIFYPAEDAEKPTHFVPMLLPLVKDRFAEVDIHLHHEDDTPENLTRTLNNFKSYLDGLGMLGRDPDGKPRYGFIHGNWALCNGRPDGKHCGVNEELDILLKTGCYADFTFPSIPSPTQPRHFCNRIYYSKDLPGRPRSYDKGKLAEVGYSAGSDELMMIQGPAGFNWHWRKYGVLPRIEHADLCQTNPPTPGRANLWISQRIGVVDRPEWIFIKLHTHGCLENNMQILLDGPLENTLKYLTQLTESDPAKKLHFVSAREMYNIAKAAVDGVNGNPSDFRNHIVSPPPSSTR